MRLQVRQTLERTGISFGFCWVTSVLSWTLTYMSNLAFEPRDLYISMDRHIYGNRISKITFPSSLQFGLVVFPSLQDRHLWFPLYLKSMWKSVVFVQTLQERNLGSFSLKSCAEYFSIQWRKKIILQFPAWLHGSSASWTLKLGFPFFVEEELQHCATMDRQWICSELRKHNTKVLSCVDVESLCPTLVLASYSHHQADTAQPSPCVLLQHPLPLYLIPYRTQCQWISKAVFLVSIWCLRSGSQNL